MKIATLSVFGEDIPLGIRRQLLSEYSNRQALAPVEWTTVALTTGESDLPFVQRIPPLFRYKHLRFLYGWMVARRLSQSHDFVLIRYMILDPFGWLFAPAVKNWLPVHHTMEVEAIRGWTPGFGGRWRASLETWLARMSLRWARGIIGVTPEIATYERERTGARVPIGVYLNGIDLSAAPVVSDQRNAQDVAAAFVCDMFHPWHGLDRLFAAVKERPSEARAAGLRIHLIGALLPEQQAELNASTDLAAIFIPHGRLPRAEYERLLAESDIAIGSFAADRLGLREAATLKVREMLAAGLPLYSGHIDAALPADFPYYRIAADFDLGELIALARGFRNISRTQVRDAAAPYIRKDAMMKNVADWLGGLGNAPTR